VNELPGKQIMRALIFQGAIIAALLASGGSAWAQQAATGNPDADKAPMQAQELANLVPKDSSEPQAADISRSNARNYYRYNKRGVNCSLYPARCRGEDD
jgi:hypothetical protein